MCRCVLPSNKKDLLYLSVNVFSTKVLTDDTSFTSPFGDGTAFLRLAFCRAMKELSFLSYIKTLSNGPALGIEPRPPLCSLELHQLS